MMCVNEYSRFDFIRFLRHKHDATKALRSITKKNITSAGLQVGIIRTDGGGEFDAQFQSLLTKYGIKRDSTPPYTPQYNGVVERALRLLRDKTLSLLQRVLEGKSDRLWAEEMNYACVMSNRCVISSLDRGVLP